MAKSDTQIPMKSWASLFVLSLRVGFAVPLQAQPAAAATFRNETEAAQHKAQFLAAARAAGYTQRPEFLYNHRLDVTKTWQLRRAGVDLRREEHSILIDGTPDYPAVALYADLVVHGTVVKQTGDSSRAVFYHSAFEVQVTDTWQGQAAPHPVVARLRSGPSGAFQLNVSMEPELKLGQEVVLFLTPIDFAGYAEADKQGLAPQRNNAAPDDFDVVKVILVKEGRVFGGRVRLARARKYSKRIAAILDKEHFHQKQF